MSTKKRAGPEEQSNEPALRNLRESMWPPRKERSACIAIRAPATAIKKDGPARRLKAGPDIRRSSATERLASHPPKARKFKLRGGSRAVNSAKDAE
jgi:hypothetical protein